MPLAQIRKYATAWEEVSAVELVSALYDSENTIYIFSKTKAFDRSGIQ